MINLLMDILNSISKPPRFLYSFSEEEFVEWIHTDEYGKLQKEPLYTQEFVDLLLEYEMYEQLEVLKKYPAADKSNNAA